MTARGRTVTGPGAPAWLLACTWREWTRLEKDAYLAQFDTGSPPSAAELQKRGIDPAEKWAAILCNPGAESMAVAPGILVTGVLAAWRIQDGAPQIVHDFLIARAYAAVVLPVQVGDSAPFGDERAPMITQLPTWLWIDPAVWQPVSATTPPVFGVTATVTATPRRVAFDGGGQVVDCSTNTGPAYNFALEDDQQHSDCTLTYHHTSAVGAWTLSSTIWWEATFSCADGCGSGQLPPFVVRSTRDVRVAELQAVLLPPLNAPEAQ